MSGLRLQATLAAAMVSVGLLVAGCGSSETTVTETTTSTTTTEPSGDTTAPQGTDGAPPPVDEEVTELTPFSSPSGNIGCYIDRSSVRCDISERDWQPPAPPADCQVDYGQGVMLEAGGTADLVCAGDTALDPGAPPLAYGQSIGAGLLRCESKQSGILCADTETGRGFKLSRESYELF